MAPKTSGKRVCPDCGSTLVPTLRGFKCPRLGSCGRGGVEEVGRADRDPSGPAVDA
ncbi:MAG TPA: hypothetical protein VM889_10640 [Candidatus Thermoplasmatota archaeon]|nr:hypothetical protein [Candidatus Thermoplasmatota archaeon]